MDSVKEDSLIYHIRLIRKLYQLCLILIDKLSQHDKTDELEDILSKIIEDPTIMIFEGEL